MTEEQYPEKYPEQTTPMGQSGGGYPPPPPPQGYYGHQQVTRGANGFAIASLVLGILWIYWVGSVLALIFGYVARRQIKQRNESGDGMAIAGIVLGWIGVAAFVVVVIVFTLVGLNGGFSVHHRY